MASVPPQGLISNQLNYLAKQSGAKWEHVPATMARFNIQLSICGHALTWQVEFQLLKADWVPDFIFSDEFNPLLPLPNQPSLGLLLVGYRMHDHRALNSCFQAIRLRFMQYQHELIEAEGRHDPALSSNLSLLLRRCPDAELMFVAGYPRKAVVMVRLPDVDLSSLNDFFASAWGVNEPVRAAKHMASKMHLKIIYPLSSGAGPTARFYMPSELEALLGNIEIPDWDPRMDIAAFLGAVQVAVQEACGLAGQSAEARRQLLLALAATKFGEPAEIDMVGSRSVMFRMNSDGLAWIICIEIASNFPATQPSIRLQQHTEIRFDRTFKEYPWSPRWPAREMANRIYKFIEQTILELD